MLEAFTNSVIFLALLMQLSPEEAMEIMSFNDISLEVKTCFLGS